MRSILTSNDLSDTVVETEEGRPVTMFEMHPGTLEQGMARRHEMMRASMSAERHAGRPQRRVAEVVRFRHVVATLVAALV